MKDLLSAIINIFRYIGKIFTLIRNGIFNIMFLFIGVMVIVALLASKPKDIKDNSILVLDLSGDIVEEKRSDSPAMQFLEEALNTEPAKQEIVLQDVLDAVHSAAKEPKIRLILLKLGGLGTSGIDQLQSIGDALQDFKKSGKMVVAAEDLYTQKQYYLASFASTVLLNPMGGVDLHGLGIYPLYYQEMLDKLLVNYHVFRVGLYKSAVEPLMRNSMSDEVRNQNSEWLNSLWKTYCDGVQSRRNLPDTAVAKYIDGVPASLKSVNGDTAKLALQSGFVDRIMTRNEIRIYLNELSGLAPGDELRTLGLQKYLDHIETSHEKKVEGESRVGIIVAEGAILGGKQPAGTIGSETLSEMFRKARNDKHIKAVVFRINSGGGSAFASEIIRQEILELKKQGKPVVVSMGSMAASGGYWISADADEIWAAPSTITGSIGIFGAIPTFEKSLKKIGVTSDGVGTTQLASGLNLTRPLSPALKETIQISIENGYQKFLDIVANGRKIDTARLNVIAEGRVFSGVKAQTIGLVDKLGNLSDATASCAELAHLDSYSVEFIPRPGSLYEQLMKPLKGELGKVIFEGSPLSALFGKFAELLKNQTDILMLGDDPRHIYALTLLPQAW